MKVLAEEEAQAKLEEFLEKRLANARAKAVRSRSVTVIFEEAFRKNDEGRQLGTDGP